LVIEYWLLVNEFLLLECRKACLPKSNFADSKSNFGFCKTNCADSRWYLNFYKSIVSFFRNKKQKSLTIKICFKINNNFSLSRNKSFKITTEVALLKILNLKPF